MNPLSDRGQFVALRHEGIADPHYDLMFEHSETAALVTFRSASWPIENRLEVTRIGDHRLDYLTFEGEISGHRGRVRRVASGEYRARPSQNGLHVSLHLANGQLRLRWAEMPAGQWLVEPLPDDPAAAPKNP